MDQEKEPYIKINIRELNGELSIKMSTLYIRLLVYATVLLTYSKGHMLSIRSTCIKYVIVILFLSEPSTILHHNTIMCEYVTVTDVWHWVMSCNSFWLYYMTLILYPKIENKIKHSLLFTILILYR